MMCTKRLWTCTSFTSTNPRPVLIESGTQTSLLEFWGQGIRPKQPVAAGHMTYRAPGATHPGVLGFLGGVGRRIAIADIAPPQGIVAIDDVPRCS